VAAGQREKHLVCQIKVTLKGTRPPIWRRFLVLSDMSLHQLHQVSQVVMGWENSHLYQFVIGERHYGEPYPEVEMENSKATKLSQVVPGEATEFTYEYDFGDSWEHEVLIEKTLPAEPRKRYPLCIVGRRACPPEDCGGIWGYAELLEVIQDPEHEDHEEMLEWLGGSFDPEAFDLKEVNEVLEGLR